MIRPSWVAKESRGGDRHQRSKSKAAKGGSSDEAKQESRGKHTRTGSTRADTKRSFERSPSPLPAAASEECPPAVKHASCSAAPPNLSARSCHLLALQRCAHGAVAAACLLVPPLWKNAAADRAIQLLIDRAAKALAVGCAGPSAGPAAQPGLVAQHSLSDYLLSILLRQPLQFDWTALNYAITCQAAVPPVSVSPSKAPAGSP